jgi:hypothetical protein
VRTMRARGRRGARELWVHESMPRGELIALAAGESLFLPARGPEHDAKPIHDESIYDVPTGK